MLFREATLKSDTHVDDTLTFPWNRTTRSFERVPARGEGAPGRSPRGSVRSVRTPRGATTKNPGVIQGAKS
jgi:hypothetical protein